MQALWMQTGDLQKVKISSLEVSRLWQNLFHWGICRPDDRRTCPDVILHPGGQNIKKGLPMEPFTKAFLDSYLAAFNL